MIRSNSASLDLGSVDYGRLSRRLFSQTIPGAVALALSAAAGAWIVHSLPMSGPGGAKAPVAARQTIVATRVVMSPPAADPSPYGALFDPGFSSEMTPASLGRDSFAGSSFKPFAPAPSAAAPAPAVAPPSSPVVTAQLEIAPLPPPRPAAAPLADRAPLPPPRPAELGTRAIDVPARPAEVAARPAEAVAPASAPASVRRLAEASPKAVPAPAPGDNRSFLAKIFSWTSPSPDLSARYDKFTAVYDISAHVVYMPDGSKLEAHSGLGDKLDDTRSFSERMRGPTPPHLYELTPREELFHGVAALRLNPVGGGDLFGRAGLLAHPFMLGPNGDSNGCVSFKDYDTFLHAYQNGQVKRLAVVASLN
jgi:hypothetical protein